MQTDEQVLAIVWGNIFAAAVNNPNIVGAPTQNSTGMKSAARQAAGFADLGTAALLTRFNNAGDLFKHLENLPK